MDSVTPTTLVDRQDISQTPGADRTNSLAMITDYVPAAYVTHDMLHMRGGHQVEWLIDGVPIPNTNIAANLAPQIDPKDIDYLEVQRGSYEAEYGDRTYGIFNIVPRNGFERNNEAELVTSFGNWYQTNDQLNFGGAHRALRLLRQRQRKSQQLRSADPHRASGSRRGKRLRGIRVVHIQSQIPRTNFGWSPRCARIITRSPIDPDPNSIGNQSCAGIPVTACAIVNTNPMATSRSPGSTHSIQTCC